MGAHDGSNYWLVKTMHAGGKSLRRYIPPRAHRAAEAAFKSLSKKYILMYVEVPTKWKDNSVPFCCSAPSLQCAGSTPPPWSYDLRSEQTLQVHGSQTTTQTMKNGHLRKRRETGVSTWRSLAAGCVFVLQPLRFQPCPPSWRMRIGNRALRKKLLPFY